jgi:hypothetical protein
MVSVPGRGSEPGPARAGMPAGGPGLQGGTALGGVQAGVEGALYRRRCLLDYEAILAGYRELVPADSAAFWIYRLDAAVMLALLFTAELPHTGLGPHSVDRVHEVCLRLSRELSR